MRLWLWNINKIKAVISMMTKKKFEKSAIFYADSLEKLSDDISQFITVIDTGAFNTRVSITEIASSGKIDDVIQFINIIDLSIRNIMHGIDVAMGDPLSRPATAYALTHGVSYLNSYTNKFEKTFADKIKPYYEDLKKTNIEVRNWEKNHPNFMDDYDDNGKPIGKRNDFLKSATKQIKKIAKQIMNLIMRYLSDIQYIMSYLESVIDLELDYANQLQIEDYRFARKRIKTAKMDIIKFEIFRRKNTQEENKNE